MHLLLLALILTFSCAKHTPEDKILVVETLYGDQDPCMGPECEVIDIVKQSDPTVLLRLQKYFPHFDFDQREIDLYSLGEEFTYEAQGIFNQRFIIPTRSYVGGCIIAYQETRKIKKLIKDYITNDGEVVDRIVYDYERSQAKSLTDKENCHDFVTDDYYFNDDAKGVESYDIYPADVGELSSAALSNNASKDIQNLLIVKYRGEYYLRIEYEKKHEKFSAEVYNPRTRRIETIETKLDNKMINIRKPDRGFGAPYTFQRSKHKGKAIKQSVFKLL